MEEGAVELSAFIDKVLAATGSDKVNLLCHSQGAAVSRFVPQEQLTDFHHIARSLAELASLVSFD